MLQNFALSTSRVTFNSKMVIRRRQRFRIERYSMHDFRAYIFAKATLPPQRGLSAIAELLVKNTV